MVQVASKAGAARLLAGRGGVGQCWPMRQLLLLRHAKSSWEDRGIADRDRPLNARGRRAAAAMRTVMADLGLEPDLALVSSAKRTQQTLAALEPWAETPLIEATDSLYLAAAPALLETLQGVASTVRSVLLVGHNPGLHELAMLLMGEKADDESARRLRQGYPSGALAEFSVAGPWAGLDEGGGRLVRFVCPRDLPGG